MGDDASVVCGNCGQPLPAGTLACAHCGRQPRGLDVGSAIIRGLAILVGLMMTLFGTTCAATAMVVMDDSLPMVAMALLPLAFGIMLVIRGVDRDNNRANRTARDGTTRMTFGRRGDGQ
ncbi:MAG: hypothetical protein HZB16_04860 [Armatimonadetes bacterium]|nr:hypothetical protein [Armatimonadota bacterium]